MTNQKTYKTTENGLKKLINELKEREGKLREQIKEALNEARNQGDLRENDGYSLAIEEQNANETRIMTLKDKIENAEVVKNSCKKDFKVNVGCKVTLKGDKEITYEITGEEEANPLKGRISHLSPIGSAVMGKKVGDEVKISTPQGDKIYTIINIE